MKTILAILLILVVLTAGCTGQTPIEDVNSEGDALDASSDMGEGLGDLTTTLNDMIDSLT